MACRERHGGQTSFCMLLCSRASLAKLVQRRPAIPVAGAMRWDAMLEATRRPPPALVRRASVLSVARRKGGSGQQRGPGPLLRLSRLARLTG
jgi:hypothetical protein